MNISKLIRHQIGPGSYPNREPLRTPFKIYALSFIHIYFTRVKVTNQVVNYITEVKKI
jgi:hypothetical protein